MKPTKQVRIGSLSIGGGNPIAIQSMINIPLTETKQAIEQILRLEESGCEIIRATVPNDACADKLPEVISHIHIPLVADIHFDYRLAIRAVQSGVSKLRINPGNIGGKDRVREVVACLKEYGIPVRIGVNAGSLEKEILAKYGHPTIDAIIESARSSIGQFNEFGYDNLVISIKSSDVVTTYQANKRFAELYDYPLHLGVTEAGAQLSGVVRSSVGIGALLLDGIGDTIRVSLTGDPVQEVIAAKEILTACDLRNEGIRIISCPTCGRCKTDLLSIVTQIKEHTSDIKTPLVVAVMGCGVNGPGEAREADLGIACGDGNGVLFKKGEIVATVPSEEIVDVLLAEINLLTS
ncbi:MAG: flavodoxin-dependent (E)-4-hydroxy-3-methylbut-2-enyl-diphosphate synthase [Anaerofustis sp.]